MSYQQHQPLLPSHQQQEFGLGQQSQFGQPSQFQQQPVGQQPGFQQPQPAIAQQGGQPTAQQVPPTTAQQVPSQQTTQQVPTQQASQIPAQASQVPTQQVSLIPAQQASQVPGQVSQATGQLTGQVPGQQTGQIPQQTAQMPQTAQIPQQAVQTPQLSNLAVPGTVQQGLGQQYPVASRQAVSPAEQQYGKLQAQASGAQVPQTTGHQISGGQRIPTGLQVSTGYQIPTGQQMPTGQQVPTQKLAGQQTAQQLGQQTQWGAQASGQPVGVATSQSGQPSAGQSFGPGGSFTAQTQGMQGIQGMQAESVQQVGEKGQQTLVGTPSLDMVDTPDEIVLYVDLPGFAEEDIRIQADGQNLTISAERREDEPEEGQKLARERPLKLQRTVRLPSRANVNEADASYENGVCKITLPKMEEEKQHEIAFQ